MSRFDRTTAEKSWGGSHLNESCKNVHNVGLLIFNPCAIIMKFSGWRTNRVFRLWNMKLISLPPCWSNLSQRKKQLFYTTYAIAAEFSLTLTAQPEQHLLRDCLRIIAIGKLQYCSAVSF